jgi:hypothetical protein
MGVFLTPGGPISCHKRNCEMVKHRPIDGLTTGFDFVPRDKTSREGTTLAHKLELEEGIPTLYCPPNLYGSNSKSCAVRRFKVLVPEFFLCPLSEDVATRLSTSYIIS